MHRADATYVSERKREQAIVSQGDEDSRAMTRPTVASAMSKVAWTYPATWPVKKLGSLCSKIGSALHLLEAKRFTWVFEPLMH